MTSPRLLLAITVGLGCAHQVEEEVAVPDRDFPALARMFHDFAESIPRCADDQQSLTVEEAIAHDWAQGDCVLVRGQMTVDAEAYLPSPPGSFPGNRGPAQWILLGERSQRPSPQRLPGVAAYPLGGPHAIWMFNDYRFDKPRGLCQRNTAGQVSMPQGLWFRFPDAHRARVRNVGDGEMPAVPVVILARIPPPVESWAVMGPDEIRRRFVSGGGADFVRVCRDQDRSTRQIPSTSTSMREPTPFTDSDVCTSVTVPVTATVSSGAPRAAAAASQSMR